MLNYELSTSVLFLLASLGPLFLMLSMLASILFTPYMLYVLYKEEKNGWVISFFVVNLLIVGVNFLPIDSMIFKSSSNYIALGFFYFYCFLLRLEMVDWIKDKLAKEQREYELQNEHINKNLEI